MAKLLDGKLAKQVSKAVIKAGLTKAATLTKFTPGTRTTASGGTHPTSIAYAARGFLEDYGPELIDGTLITAQDVKISLLGASIAGGVVPVANDQIAIESKTYTIIRAERDAASAMYLCQCRGTP